MTLSISSRLATEHGCRERIQRGLAAGWRIVVAQGGGRTVGFLATTPNDRVLDQLFVSPTAKGRGIGAVLLHLAMADWFWLRCAKANRVACLFYQAHGAATRARRTSSRAGPPECDLCVAVSRWQ